MRHAKAYNITLALLGFLVIITLSVVLILNFRPLYRHDMKTQNLSQLYSVSEDEIIKNYDALIDYNSLFYRGELRFPTLPMSHEGKIHFQEVKQIFDLLQLLLLLSVPAFLLMAIHAVKKRQLTFLLLIPCITGTVAAVVLLLALLDWQFFFTAFHRLVFQNDYWLFDPDTDPIINFLPDSFFFHCLAGILLCMAVLLGLCLFLHQILKRSQALKNSTLPQSAEYE